MKKIIFLVAICFISMPLFAQEEESHSFRYRSFSVSPIGVYSGEDSGLTVNLDVSFDYDRNIFGMGIGAGANMDIFGYNEEFKELNLLYGRSFSLNEKTFADVFIGGGYFNYRLSGVTDSVSGEKGKIEKSTIGFPIGVKFHYLIGSRFSMGLRMAVNINATQSIGTLGLVLQWNRKGS